MTQSILRTEADGDVEQRFRAAGLTVPADRAAGTHAAALRLLEQAQRLRQARVAAAEPAHVFQAQRSPAA